MVTILDELVTIGDAQAFVVSSTLVPGTVGEYEVDALVPANIQKGPGVTVSVGGGNTVTMAVQ